MPQATMFPQINAHLRVQDLHETVESLLGQAATTSQSVYDKLQKVFQAIEAAMVTPAYAYYANEARESLISDPDIFRGDEKDSKKNQDLFQTFTAQIQLKIADQRKGKNYICGKQTLGHCVQECTMLDNTSSRRQDGRI
jgi:hypothetical protein